MEKVKAGVIGCGLKSELYYRNIPISFKNISLIGCADIDTALASKNAKEFNIPLFPSPETLINDSNIDVILNLTFPEKQLDLTLQALETGKHVYSGVPTMLDRESALLQLDTATRKRVKLGGAPDNFLGKSHQLCREKIDKGVIGDITYAAVFGAYSDDFPFSYSDLLGLREIKAYYLAALINILGPIARVSALSGLYFPSTKKIIPTKKNQDKKNTMRTVGAIEFAGGMLGTMIIDAASNSTIIPRIEFHGTEGILILYNPAFHESEVRLLQKGKETVLSETAKTNCWGLGLSEMAQAILADSNHRTNEKVGAHIVDVLLSLEESSVKGVAISTGSFCPRPDAYYLTYP